MSKSIKKNFAYNSFLMVSNYIINLILFPFCARVLGVERFGTINFTQNIVQYFMFIAMMGITHVGVREIAKQTNKQDLNKCYSSMLGLNLLYTVFSLAIFVPLIFLVDRLAEIKILFFLGAFQILFSTFSVEWYFRGTENFKYITVRNIIIKIIYVVCVFIFVKEPNDYTLFFLLTVLMTAICAIINYMYAHKYVQFSLRDVNLRTYLKPSLSLGAYSILTSMYTTFNVAYLGMVWDDVNVGYYTTALKLYTVILGFYSAFTSVMLPRMTAITGKGDENSFNGLINKSFELFYTISIPMVAVLFVLAPEVISLLAGSEYEPSIMMSRIVVPMLFVVGIAQILSFQILIPKGFDKITLYASIIGAVVGVVANIILTTRYGALGTCITVVITEVCVTIYYTTSCIKHKLVSFDLNMLFKHILAALPYLAICIAIQKFSAENWLLTLILSCLVCALYFVVSQYYILNNSLVMGLFSKLTSKKN